jgi:hypothetical protein
MLLPKVGDPQSDYFLMQEATIGITVIVLKSSATSQQRNGKKKGERMKKIKNERTKVAKVRMEQRHTQYDVGCHLSCTFFQSEGTV